MQRKDRIWQNKEMVAFYLETTRTVIPVVTEQFDVLFRLIAKTQSDVKSVLDLGCGNGIMGRAIHEVYPEARIIFVGFSEPMLDQARQLLPPNEGHITYITADMAHPTWQSNLTNQQPFDIVVSRFAIHHLAHSRKMALYAEIFDVLKPGGFFINIEHVASASDLLVEASEDYFIEALYRTEQENGGSRTYDEIATEFRTREDQDANILATTEDQCNWLRAIGFHHVDCYLRYFEIAAFGGVKPRISRT